MEDGCQEQEEQDAHCCSQAGDENQSGHEEEVDIHIRKARACHCHEKEGFHRTRSCAAKSCGQWTSRLRGLNVLVLAWLEVISGVFVRQLHERGLERYFRRGVDLVLPLRQQDPA